MTLLLRSIVTILLTFSFNAQASDLAKEKRWADQVVDSILDGDAVWLNNGQHDFLGIYTEAEENQDRAVIIMHGTGIHPDWQQVIQPLRVGLIEHGWHTLSIQMPVLNNEAEYLDYAPLFDEVAPRIDAAINHLKSLGIKNISLIGHSLGSAMSAHYLTTTKQEIKSFVAIGMAALAKDKRMNAILSLEKITIPTLDIYGDDDLDKVIMSIDDRAAAAKKAGNQHFTQIEIEDSNHFFDDQNEALIEAIANWLK